MSQTLVSVAKNCKLAYRLLKKTTFIIWPTSWHRRSSSYSEVKHFYHPFTVFLLHFRPYFEKTYRTHTISHALLMYFPLLLSNPRCPAEQCKPLLPLPPAPTPRRGLRRVSGELHLFRRSPAWPCQKSHPVSPWLLLFHLLAVGSWDNVSKWTAKAKLYRQKHIFSIYKIPEVKKHIILSRTTYPDLLIMNWSKQPEINSQW